MTLPEAGESLPAAGVMTTAPMTEGFPKKITSIVVQLNKLVAAQTWVLRTAKAEIM
jgi:hypothetical protein